MYRTRTFVKKEQIEEGFNNLLQIDPAEYDVIVLKETGTEQSTLISKANVLFDEFNVKGCAFTNAQTAILSSWAHGYNGLIIDIGYQNAICTPIINGNPINGLCGFSNTVGKSKEKIITDCVINTIKSCLTKIGPKNLERIIFCGGNQVSDLISSLMKQLNQFPDIKKSIENYEISIKNVPSEQSAISSWVGGSVLFSISELNNFITTQADFENNNRIIDFIEEKLAKAIIDGNI